MPFRYFNCVSRAMAILLEIFDFQQRKAVPVPCTQTKSAFRGSIKRPPLFIT